VLAFSGVVVESFNGSAAVLSLMAPVVAGPTRTVSLSVSLASQSTAPPAVASYALVAPPTAMSAIFTSALTTISLTFDGPTNRCALAGCGDSCSCALDVASAARLAGVGGRASCVWAADGASLSVQLGTGATIAPGDSLTFTSCLASPADSVALPGAASILVTVSAPTIPIAPTVTITGPGAIDSCSALELSAAAFRSPPTSPRPPSFNATSNIAAQFRIQFLL
jgi:hypothetical protein